MSAFGQSTHTGLGCNGFEVSLNYITGVPDPNHLSSDTLKLAFKSLLKRDASTKEKSITSMHEYLNSNPTEMEDDLVIITWVQMYPKLAIDDSKKVRLSSHQIQATFVKSLGKKYAKYLKDTIGIWLAGIFDSDRSAARVCRESINTAFDNNKEKIANVWKIFVQQILQYAYQVLAFETKDTISDERFTTNDESETKFIRVVQASNHLIVQALQTLNSMELTENVTSIIQSIYEQELLHTCFVSTDFNLKKSAFMTFKYLVTSKHVDSLITKSIYKSLAKSMIKGIKFDSKINSLLYGTCLISMLDTMVCVTNYDASFWANIKKADDKLIALLNYGSLNSEPIYYDVVFKLLTITPDDVFSFTNLEKFEPFYNSILKSVGSEKTLPFIEKGWKIIINMMNTAMKSNTLSDSIIDSFTFTMIKLLDSPRLLSPSIVSLMHNIQVYFNDNKDTLLDINSTIMDALPNQHIVFHDLKEYTVKYSKTFVESFLNILLANKSDLSEVLLANAVESVLEIESADEKPVLAFIVIDAFISKDKAEFDESIFDFISNLPKVINKDFIEMPLNTLKLFTHTRSATEATINPLVNEIFKKLDQINQVPDLMKIISKFHNFNIHDAEDLSDYLVRNSRSLSPETANINEDSLYAFLTPTILANRFENENFDSFVNNCVKNFKNDIFVEFAILEPNFLQKLAFSVLADDERKLKQFPDFVNLLNKMESNIESNKAFADVFCASIYEAVSNFDGDSTQLIDNLSSNTINFLVTRDLKSEIKSISEKYPQKSLSVSNSMDLGLYFFTADYEVNDQIDFINAKKILNKACFYSALLAIKVDEMPEDVTDLLILAEYSSDVVFLNTSLSLSLQNKYMKLRTDAMNLLNDILVGFTYSEFVQFLQTKTSDDLGLQSLLDLLSSDNQLVSYYAYRIMKNVLEEKTEYATLKDFESIDLKSLSTDQASLYSVISTATPFLTSKHIEFSRMTVFSNLSSIRDPAKILTDGLKNLVLLNSFMNLDLDYEIPESYNLFTPQRCMMLLNVLSNWLDSEVAFEENFKFNRIALLRFAHLYLTAIYYVCDSNYPSDFIAKVFSLSTRLVSENINLINQENDIPIDLLLESLKLYLLLTNYKPDIESWAEDFGDIQTEIMEIFFKFAKVKEMNRPAQMLCSLFDYIFYKDFKNDALKADYEQLFNLLESENVDIQRIAATLLHRMIPEVQDNLVVEFTLAQKQDNEDDDSGIKLNKTLVEITKTPLADYIEYEPEWKVHQYLWSWYLIIDHFKNITQQMRQDYINDLGEARIGDFLDFIFSEIDMSKFKLHDDEIDYVKTYTFDDHHSLIFPEEIKKLLVNLVYEIMDTIGGTFAQNWFQSIKDKQTQSNVEKFIAKYISPPLINDILLTLSNKTALEDTDFKITINRKINEIKCRYDIDEQKMEISILLPPTYPLAQITVSGVSRVGVNEKKWKSWLMSAQYVINFQNGSILDAIKHFKDNVTANFENYEDCAVCYSILNYVDHSTPNKVCTTCKHNFHSACLYRWFKSSGASTCPLCRSKFNFKKHS